MADNSAGMYGGSSIIANQTVKTVDELDIFLPATYEYLYTSRSHVTRNEDTSYLYIYIYIYIHIYYIYLCIFTT